jgi:hypothetical protein
MIPASYRKAELQACMLCVYSDYNMKENVWKCCKLTDTNGNPIPVNMDYVCDEFAKP